MLLPFQMSSCSTQTQELYDKCITLHSGYVSSIPKTKLAQVRPVLRIKIK